jgi:hypothetical protein
MADSAECECVVLSVPVPAGVARLCPGATREEESVITQTTQPDYELAFGVTKLKLRCQCGFYAGFSDQPVHPDQAQQWVEQLWEIGLQHNRDTGDTVTPGHVAHIQQESVAYVSEFA